MGADVSRVRFDPLRDHSGVLMQQGRLLLDADWNEQADVVARRIRAGAADLGSHGPVEGIAGVAAYPATTPDAFRITIADGQLLIGRGRMYVDGLLAENHGAGADEFDPVLSETRHTDPVPYSAQPYWPTPVSPETDVAYLAYLDVWEREVTHLEWPDLVEPGVAVDTTTRTQTAWQVRLHPLGGSDTDCATKDADIPDWLDVTAPSGGRLTTGTVEVPDEEDPCSLPPSGGYRGLENQTYRVEIHSGGEPGAATFKWATDNASVASPVVEVLTPATLRPASLGRDEVLSFHTGDWVEVLDDHYELNRQPGAMFRITVDPDAETIILDNDLPSDLRLSKQEAEDRHLRIRRWSQRGQIKNASGDVLENLDNLESSGVIRVPSGDTVMLDHGVTVRLEVVPGGVFRPGDHWIFTARTNDTSVEQLTMAAPRGVHHHYARLSVVAFPSDASDCRRPWPPAGDGCGDCTVCVTPESHANGTFTIQNAVDEVTPTGGTVCLAAGEYAVPEGGILIQGANGVTVHGQGPRTVLSTEGPAIAVRGCLSILLENFAVYSDYRGYYGNPLVELVDTADTTVRRLHLTMRQAELTNADRTNTDSETNVRSAIGLGGVAIGMSLRDNVIVAGYGIAVVGRLLTSALDISGNTFFSSRAVALDGTVAHVLANSVRHNSFQWGYGPAVRVLGQVGPDGAVTVADNTIFAGGMGIEVAGAGYDVRGNTLTGFSGGGDYYAGIAVVPGFGEVRGSVRITGNTVDRYNGPAISVRVPVTDAVVSDNLVKGSTHGITMDERGRAETISVAHNVIRRLYRWRGGATGIRVVATGLATVESNVIGDFDVSGEQAENSTGILVIGTRDARVMHNTIEQVDRELVSGSLSAIGIQVGSLFRRVTVAGNSVRLLADDPTSDSPRFAWTGLLIGQPDQDPPYIVRFTDYVTAFQQTGYLIGHQIIISDFTGRANTMAVVEGNMITGAGGAAAAMVGISGDLVVSGNLFRQVDNPPALHVVAGSATVTGNRARGGSPSILLQLDPQRMAVLGNLTSNGVVVNGTALGAPWAALNPNGV